jgi:hypothetical protein
VSALALALLVVLAEPSAAAPLTGTWISESGPLTNVTSLNADGTYTTKHRLGTVGSVTTTGRWERRGAR